MKNLFKTAALILATFTLFISCNREDDANTITETAKIKIDSVQIPQATMQVYSVQSIRTFSTYQEGCEGFYGYDYVRDGFTRTVTPYKFKVKANCGKSISGVSQLNFAPQEAGTYTFKFYNGDNNWITKTIVVQ